MNEPTRDDIDALVGSATPHFAYQLAARLRELGARLRSAADRTMSDESGGSSLSPKESGADSAWDDK